jgi:hypothetical protein
VDVVDFSAPSYDSSTSQKSRGAFSLWIGNPIP